MNNLLTQLAILLNEIHLREHIDMRHLHLKHGGQRGTEHRYELGWIGTVMRVHQMHRGQLESRMNNPMDVRIQTQ